MPIELLKKFWLKAEDLVSRKYFLIISLANLLFFHWPLLEFILKNMDVKSISGILLISSIILILIILNGYLFFLFHFISRRLGKTILTVFFLINSIAIYFITTYHNILDESMMGNVFNTDSAEAKSFLSIKMIIYLILLGIIPSLLILRAELKKISWKSLGKMTLICLGSSLILVFANGKNWLWVDKNAKVLGGLVMPWSYTINTIRLYKHQADINKKELLLPKARIKDKEKAVMVLVIGESARKKNFSLYGYKKNTNPHLSKVKGLQAFDALANATYTTAGVKAILDAQETDELYEILPNYLNRHGIGVIWRTTNWGEPPVHIQNYFNTDALKKGCLAGDCEFDGILFKNLRQEIESMKEDKILVVLHTSTSHGPTYFKKYPKEFEKFKPVCTSVELANCSQTELINAYDNTIVYTDYLLANLIGELKKIPNRKAGMIFISDHGESLGENNLYMHGIPKNFAPKEQLEIPFLVWTSDQNLTLKPKKTLSQFVVFHSILNFLHIESKIYQEDLNIFGKN